MIFSMLLAIGNLSDLFGSLFLEVVTILVGISILFKKENHRNILKYCEQALPLFLILFILFIASVFYGYTGFDGKAFNFKFLLAILVYVLLSAFFENDMKSMLLALLFFSIGAALLSVLYSFNLLAEGLLIRNGRLIFLGENPNSLSVRISLSVFILVWLALNNPFHINRFKRLIFLAPTPFMLALIIASGSKGSFVLCLLSVFGLLFISKNITKKIKFVLILIFVISAFLSLDFLLTSNLYLRFLESEFTSGRTDIWVEALEIFYSNPFGVGEDGYFQEIQKLTGTSIDTHNLFVYLLVTGGFISLALFIYFYFTLLKKAVKSYKINREPLFFVIWISMFLVLNKTGGVLTYLVMWFFLAMINNFNATKEESVLI
jgi:O-antigen ligase